MNNAMNTSDTVHFFTTLALAAASIATVIGKAINSANSRWLGQKLKYKPSPLKAEKFEYEWSAKNEIKAINKDRHMNRE